MPEKTGSRDSHTALASLLQVNFDVVDSMLRSTDGSDRSAMSGLIAARTASEVLQDVTSVLVARARRDGHTWAEIGQLLRISRQAAQQRFGGSEVEAVPVDDTATRRALQIVEQLRAEDWDAVTADWDDTMRAAVGVEKLASVWGSLVKRAGALEAVGRPSTVSRGVFRVVDVALAFRRGPMRARVTFNDDDSVAGLLLMHPDAS